MTSRLTVLLGVLVILLAGAHAQARTFTLPLPGLVGYYNNLGSRQIQYNFGQKFRTISGVNFRATGNFDPGWYEAWSFDPPRFMSARGYPGLYVNLYPNNQSADGAPFNLGEGAFDVQYDFSLTAAEMERALLGQGKISFGINALASIYNLVCVEQSWATVNQASLVVEGTLMGDFNNDGGVTDADYTLWADNYNRAVPSAFADGNTDNVFTDADYTLWADNYSPAGLVPEPATLGLLAAGLVGLPRRA